MKFHIGWALLIILTSIGVVAHTISIWLFYLE